MILSQKNKEKLYLLNKILFRWSIIFFLVLVVLEDSKKSIVSAHFMPHIFVPMIFLFAIMTFIFSENKIKPEKEYIIKKIDKILAIISGIICASFFLLYVKNFSWFSILIVILLTVLVYFFIIYMLKEFIRKD